MDYTKKYVSPYTGVGLSSNTLDKGTAPTLQEQILEDNASWEEKRRSIQSTVKNNSWIQALGDKTYDSEGNEYKDDEEFELDFSSINSIISTRGLADTTENFAKISEVKSGKELEDMINDIELKSFEEDVARQVLSDKEILGTIAVTELASVENVMGIGLGIGLAVKTVKGSLAVTGTSEVLGAKGRMEADPTMSLAEGMLNVGLSVVPEMAIIHGINKFDAAKLASKVSEVPTKTQLTNDQGQLLLAMPTEDRLKVIARLETEARDKRRLFEASAAANAKQTAKGVDEPVANESFMDWYKTKQRAIQKDMDLSILTAKEKVEFQRLLKEEEVRVSTKIDGQAKDADKIRQDELAKIDSEITETTNQSKMDELQLKKDEINRTTDQELSEITDGKYIDDADLSPMLKSKIEAVKKDVEQISIDIRNEVELDAMIKRFETDPKYEPSAIKSTLRNLQKQSKKLTLTSKKATINSKKINSIKTAITKLNDKIAAIRLRAKNAGRPVSSGEKSAITRMQRTLKTHRSRLSSNLDARVAKVEARELNRLTRMIGETFDDTAEAILALRTHIKGLSLVEATEFKASIDLLAKTSPEFKALQTDIANILKGKFEPKKFNVKNLTRKQKAILIGAVTTLGATQSSASGFDTSTSDSDPIFGIGMGQAVMLIAIALGLKSLVSAFKGNGSLKEAVANKVVNVKQAMEFSEANTGNTGTRIKQMKDEVLDKISSKGLFDIHASLASYGGEIKKYGDDMLFSFEHGKYAAEMEKTHLADAAIRKVYDEFNNGFTAWLKENNIGKVISVRDHDKLMRKFDGEIADALETGKGSKAVIGVAEVMKKENDRMFEALIDAGVLGAKDAKKLNGYFARMWKREHIQDIFRMNPKNKDIFRDALRRSMLKQGNSRPDAIDANVESLMKSFEQTSDGRRGQSHDEVFGKIEDLLKAGVDEAMVEAKLAKYADRHNRLKGRIDLDVMDLDGLKLIDGNGDELILELGNIVDRSSMSVFTNSAYSNYANVAMSRKGFNSRTKAMRHIDLITKDNPIAKRDLEDITDMIYGRRINNESEGANHVANSLVDATIVANLGAVAFSTSVEVMLTFALRNPIKGFTNALKVGFGNKNDFLTTIQDKIPLGISHIINKGNVRGFEPEDATAMFNDRSAFSKATHDMKMATISYSGLSRISDFLQKVNLVTHTEILADFLNTGKGLSKNRLTGYGIDDNTIALLQNKFTFKNGNVQTPDFDKWSDVEIGAFTNIISRMNEEVTLSRTIGGSGLWQARSNAGKLASSMLGYSTQLVSKQLVRGMKAMDVQTAKTTLLTIMGAYAGLYMRSQVEGKNYTDEQLMTYAILNIPVAQPYSILMGLSNPVVVQTTQDMANAFKIQ